MKNDATSGASEIIGQRLERSRALPRVVVALRDMLQGPLVRNAGSLYATTIVTSLFGFVYWLAAARMTSPTAVGTASAIQSAAQFLSAFGVIGLNTVMIAQLAANKARARSTILTASAAVGGVALVVSATAAFVLRATSGQIRPGVAGAVGIALFVALTALITVLLVLDNSCIGLLRGDLQLQRNTVFAIAKLLLLPVLIVLWPSRSGSELELAWLIGLAASLLVVSRALGRLTAGQPFRFDFRGLVREHRLVLGHFSLNLSVASPGVLLPVLVAAIVGPKANAGYTVAMLLAGFVNAVPFQLATVLFALAPGDELGLRRHIPKTLAISAIVGAAATPFAFLFGRVVLSVFGHSYVSASGALVVLVLTVFPSTVNAHYIAIARIRGRMRQAAVWTLLGASLEAGLGAAGGFLSGVTGAALGVLTGLVLEALILLPAVVGAFKPAGRFE